LEPEEDAAFSGRRLTLRKKGNRKFRVNEGKKSELEGLRPPSDYWEEKKKVLSKKEDEEASTKKKGGREDRATSKWGAQNFKKVCLTIGRGWFHRSDRRSTIFSIKI